MLIETLCTAIHWAIGLGFIMAASGAMWDVPQGFIATFFMVYQPLIIIIIIGWCLQGHEI